MRHTSITTTSALEARLRLPNVLPGIKAPMRRLLLTCQSGFRQTFQYVTHPVCAQSLETGITRFLRNCRSKSNPNRSSLGALRLSVPTLWRGFIGRGRMDVTKPRFYLRHLVAVITVAGIEIGLIRGALVAPDEIAGGLAVLAMWFAICVAAIWLLGTWPWNSSHLPHSEH